MWVTHWRVQVYAYANSTTEVNAPSSLVEVGMGVPAVISPGDDAAEEIPWVATRQTHTGPALVWVPDPRNVTIALRVCAYFNESRQGWAGDGCVPDFAASNATHTLCQCTHFTTFATLSALDFAAEAAGETKPGLNIAAIVAPISLLILSVCAALIAVRWRHVYHTYGRHPFASTKGAGVLQAVGRAPDPNRPAPRYIPPPPYDSEESSFYSGSSAEGGLDFRESDDEGVYMRF